MLFLTLFGKWVLEFHLNLCLIYIQPLCPPLIRRDTVCGVWSCLTLCKLCSIHRICLKCVMLLWWLLSAYLNVIILVLCEDVYRFYFRGHPIHQLLFLLQVKQLSVSVGSCLLIIGLLTLGFIRPSSEVLIYKDTLYVETSKPHALKFRMLFLRIAVTTSLWFCGQS